MTGHQPHPGTGFTATGEPASQVSLEAVAKALGAGLVEVIDPYDLDKAVEGFKRAKDFPGLSVIIARQACVIKARRSGGGRKAFAVGEDCAGCRLCVDFGCPAIEFEGAEEGKGEGEGARGKARINALCTGCGVCAQLCPSSCIEEVKK
jgi:indolepyruvate ferredoxin oxidoreductase alpha subunit